MQKITEILIIGANFSNKGAEAMLMTVQQELKERFSDAKFYMLCRQYEKELAEKNNITPLYDDSSEPVKIIKSFIRRAEGKLTKIITGKNKPFVFPFPFKSIKKNLPHIDLIIDISGFAYSDSWGRLMILETIKLIDLSKKNNTKFYFFPQAWGSFDKVEIAAAAKEMILKSDRFYARDTVSRHYLASILNKPDQEVSLLPDIALNFKGNEINNKDLMESVGYNKGSRPLIGISPNLRVYEKIEGDRENNKYIQILLTLCEYCLKELEADILLIPNEIFPDGMNAPDDRVLCKTIYELINSSDRCFIVDQYRSAEEIKSFVGQVDILISSRFHALIFGILHHLPVMAISWSHKYKELFSLFQIEDFVLEWDAMDNSSAINLLKRLVSEKEEVSQKITKNLGGLQQKVNDMFDDVVASATADK